ncbi:geminin-like isoform X2 [Oscarella lobularis]|uniref:geminin-like isoform X2 n=1 Tax=Oscarella lobularis TaxID=121494 RepID=UPI003313CB47
MDSQAPRKPGKAKTSEKQQKAKKSERIALNDTNRKDTPRPGPKVKSVFKKPTSSHISMCTAPVAPTEYWKEISEQRRLALKEALDENKKLYGELDVLKGKSMRNAMRK